MRLKFKDFPSSGFTFIFFFALINDFTHLSSGHRTNLRIKFGQPKELLTDELGRFLDNSDFERAANLESAIPSNDAVERLSSIGSDILRSKRASIPDKIFNFPKILREIIDYKKKLMNDKIGDVGFAGYKIDPIESAGYFEGDIILKDILEYKRLKVRGRDPQTNFRNQERKWPQGKIPYVISAEFNSNERAKIARAVLGVHNKTCIRFIPRKDEVDYTYILRGDGCYSSVGRVGGRQILSIGEGCFNVGTIMHELMHTIGFWHEHSRWDRDEYIEVIWSNIRMGMRNNFDKYEWYNSESLGVEYDLGSIMHYGPYAFSNDGTEPTIIPKKNADIGQRSNYSVKDLKKMNILYNCPGTTTTTIGNNCTDSNDYCLAWSLKGKCDKHPKWMKKNCRRSCKECENQKSCVDMNVHCASWAKHGYCTSNPLYMLINCQLSCNSCL